MRKEIGFFKKWKFLQGFLLDYLNIKPNYVHSRGAFNIGRRYTDVLETKGLVMPTWQETVQVAGRNLQWYNGSDEHMARLMDEYNDLTPIHQRYLYHGNSMNDVLQNRDVLYVSLLDEIMFGKARYYTGDLVIVTHPLEQEKYLVRRITASEPEELVNEESGETLTLGEDEYWLSTAEVAEGEAKEECSEDFGPVSKSHIVGRVIVRLPRTEWEESGNRDVHFVNNSWEATGVDLMVTKIEMKIMSAPGPHSDISFAGLKRPEIVQAADVDAIVT
eukprot:GFYU01021315.1.p1 GENE.GFYU01021315.1~~GFYU01021315.1.p1  ORF type:complete len:275 (-),score=62.17 GFYU01021315.1:39-863(-)